MHHDGYPTHRRKVRFDWSNTPLHSVPDDPFATHFWNVMHLLLPEGERQFIKAVNEATPLVDDPELKVAIKPFVQQESWHAWAHQVVLDHLAEQGIDTKPYIDDLVKWTSTGGNQHPGWPMRLQRWWLYRRLADVAALEHFTTVLGQSLIQSRGLDYAGTDPVMIDLLRWHGAEEVEHRSLVFDVYQNVCGNTAARVVDGAHRAGVFVLVDRRGAFLNGARPNHHRQTALEGLVTGCPRAPGTRGVESDCEVHTALYASQPSSQHRSFHADGDGLWRSRRLRGLPARQPRPISGPDLLRTTHRRAQPRKAGMGSATALGTVFVHIEPFLAWPTPATYGVIGDPIFVAVAIAPPARLGRKLPSPRDLRCTKAIRRSDGVRIW